MGKESEEPQLRIAALRGINAGIALARLNDAERTVALLAAQRQADLPEPAVQAPVPPPVEEMTPAAVVAPRRSRGLARRLLDWITLGALADRAADADPFVVGPEQAKAIEEAALTPYAATPEQVPAAHAHQLRLPVDPPPMGSASQDTALLFQQVLLRDDVMQLRLRELEHGLTGISSQVEALDQHLRRLPLPRHGASKGRSLSGRLSHAASSTLFAQQAGTVSDREDGARGVPFVQVTQALRRVLETQRATQEHVSTLLQRNFVSFDDVHAIRSANGYLLVPSSDKALVLALIEAQGCLERGTLAVILDLLRPGDLMIDVGANVGTMSLPAADLLRGTGRVIAVEPVPSVANLLRATATLNGLERELTVEECAAGRGNASATFHVGERTTHSSSWPGLATNATTIDVLVRPLDDMVPPGTAVRLIKVDAEGDELNVWAGMPRIMAENAGMMVILEFGPAHLAARGVAAEEWFDALSVPLDCIWEIVEEDGRLGPASPERLAGRVSTNLLVAPAGLPEALRHRL